MTTQLLTTQLLDRAPLLDAPSLPGERGSSAQGGVTTIQLHDDLWRVTRPDGEVLGYVERNSTTMGSRFVAKRMLQRQRRFLAVGEFWEFGAAMDCFRF